MKKATIILGVLAGLVLGAGQAVALEVDDGAGAGDCAEIEITELFTNFRNDASEQFVEFYNPTGVVLSLEGCVVQTKYGGKTVSAEFGEAAIRSGEYQAYSLQSLGLQIAKSPTVSRVFEIVGGAAIELTDLPKASIGKSFALVDGVWINATPTPSADNKMAPEFAAAESSGEGGSGAGLGGGSGSGAVGGTGVTPEVLAQLEHEVGGSSSGTEKEYADCGEGRYRNPETNRCKKIEEEQGPKPCAEGYERNPETNRCRKVRENTGVAAGFTVPDSGGTAASATDALDRVFRDENGYLQGWKVVLAVVVVVLGAGVGLCYWQRKRLKRTRFYAKILEFYHKISRKY